MDLTSQFLFFLLFAIIGFILVFKVSVVVENLVNALPAMVLGDLAGSMVAKVTGDEK